MAGKIILFNKPYGVLCQFTDADKRSTLADFIPIKGVYAAGRLDKDSEGLVILTDDGKLQNRISDPKYKLAKTYWVQVEGTPSPQAIEKLSNGIMLKDGISKPAKVKIITEPKGIWPRTPPIRERKTIPTCWISISLTEGRNRQVRRMTAASGFPTLRLIRHSIGHWQLNQLQSGKYLDVSNPRTTAK